MKKSFAGRIIAFTLGLGFAIGARAAGPVEVENLLRSHSDVADGVEIVISVIEIAPGFTLPKHYHPGEEFVYVLEGEATLWQQDKPDLVLHAGEVYKIPLEQVHTAMTGDSAAKAIVFRVHRQGAPERISVE